LKCEKFTDNRTPVMVIVHMDLWFRWNKKWIRRDQHLKWNNKTNSQNTVGPAIVQQNVINIVSKLELL